MSTRGRGRIFQQKRIDSPWPEETSSTSRKESSSSVPDEQKLDFDEILKDFKAIKKWDAQRSKEDNVMVQPLFETKVEMKYAGPIKDLDLGSEESQLVKDFRTLEKQFQHLLAPEKKEKEIKKSNEDSYQLQFLFDPESEKDFKPNRDT